MEPQETTIENKFGIGFFFLCLGVLITLITSVVPFLNLVFETLNVRFPDVLNSVYQYGHNTYQYDGIRMAISTLIIFFPIFIAISYYWDKFSKRGLTHKNEMVRKWLIYIILFLSSLVIIIDLVTLVRYFISGEVTSRFIMKVVSVLIVAVVVGLYYIFVLQWKNDKKRSIVFSVVSIVLVLSAVIYSFMIMGSPMKQRQLRMDDRRLQDLQSIQYQIIYFWQRKEKLPTSLSELPDPLGGFSLPVPPEVEKGEVYEYKLLDKQKFELCATFAQPIPKGWQEYSDDGIAPMFDVAYKDSASRPYPYPSGGINESWDHQAGRACFERTIDKELYPPFPKSAI